LSPKRPDFIRFCTILYDATTIFHDRHPKADDLQTIAPEIITKLNDSYFACLTIIAVPIDYRAIPNVRNRKKIGSFRRQIVLNRAAIGPKRAQNVSDRGESDQIVS
ncbi:MAG: hypothetical protein WKG03_07910, partial [Telluria sp.]